MIAMDPSARPTFDTLLHTSRGTVFPECFYSFLHNYVSSVNEINSPSLFSATATPSTIPASATVSAHKVAGNNVSASVNLNGDMPNDPLPSDSDHRMERIWADYESVEPYLINDAMEETVMDVKIDYVPQLSSSRPFHVSVSPCWRDIRDLTLK